MSMLRILLIIIFLVAAFAVTVIVLMQEGKSAGLGSMAGGASGGDSYWAKNKKHSLEGKFERWTKLTAAIFVLSAFFIMLIPNGSSNAAQTIPAETTTTGANEGADVEVGTPKEDATADEATKDEVTKDEVTTDEAATDHAVAETDANSTDSETASN